MKKYTKTIFCGIALCGIGILGGFGVNAVRGYAAEEGEGALANTYFEMEGATVRLSDPTGLRFSARLDAESYKKTVADAESTQKTVSYGVFIFPMDKLQEFMGEEYTNFQTYNENYKYLNEILTEENAKTYLEYYGIINLECIPVPVDEDHDGNPDYYRVNGSISNVLYNNMGREFFGLAYKKVGPYKEDNASYSYEYTYANFEDKSNVWSLSYVSSAAYANDWEGSTKEDKNILQGFIKQALLKKAGVTKEVAADVLQNKDFDWTLSLSQTQTEMTVGAKESLTWQTSFTASGTEYTEVIPDLSVKYLSNAPSVVEVSADGTLSAISAGEATITASCMGKTATCTVTVSASVEPETEYTITVNGGTASATKATADTLITLTPNPAPEGQVFDRWEVVAEEEVVITDNKFTMPACNVEITAMYKAEETHEYLAFSDVGKDNLGDTTVVAAAGDNKSMTVTMASGGQQGGYAYMLFNQFNTDALKAAATTVTFTITNTSNTEMTICAGIIGKNGGALYTLTEVNGKKLDNATKAVVSVGAGASVTVTIKMSQIDYDGYRLSFLPNDEDSANVSAFTVSNVYIGG